ncbi:MAG: modification methylase [Chlorobiaceae bacterium]|nr:modification methylase [Chlorobiaceae bacterium]MBA4310391.1 modification methylase [Chlorobiaceae bacterium]
MNYIGSKNKLSDFIISEIKNEVGEIKDKVFCEIFAGTGIISRKIKLEVEKIIANDIEYYSYVLLRNYIGNQISFDYKKELEELNSSIGSEGFIFKNYCFSNGCERNYFSDENGKKIDAIRAKIENWKATKKISDDKYFFYLTSLLEAADKVANTASVYGAYLKHLKKTARANLNLEPAIFDVNGHQHEIFNEDANELIKKIEGDILYLDPPYNHRQYGSNYHLLNTIADYKYFKPRGKTGLPNYFRSKYCFKNNAAEVLESLIQSANFEYIFLSYNNEGIIDLEKIKKIFQSYGNYSVKQFNGYQRFKADRDENRKYIAKNTVEYLHILKKRG